MKTCTWGCLNSAYGLAPVLILWALTKLPLKPQMHDYVNGAYAKVVGEGALNFFFLAMVGAASVDILLARRKFHDNFAWIMFALGGVATVLIVFLYMAFLLGGDEKHTFGQARGILWCTAIFTLLFCATIKYRITLKEIVGGLREG